MYQITEKVHGIINGYAVLLEGPAKCHGGGFVECTGCMGELGGALFLQVDLLGGEVALWESLLEEGRQVIPVQRTVWSSSDAIM